ncbi:DUF4332 domain-containing protein [bacterium]|nr:DUF4332 domain-containing protein [bacterium]
MNLLFRVIYSAHCRGTHHKLAMDGLRQIVCPDVDRWQHLFLAHHAMFLAGAKEPDVVFKDFVNHVLHVEQNNWGGAPKAAEKWFYNTVRSLQNGDWDHAARAAGILSHYVVDPIMPFHTGQSTAENNIHRACEWSVSRSYDSLIEMGQRSPRPTILLDSSSDWLSRLIIRSAEMSHQYYQALIDHYDFHAGVKNPLAGLDATGQVIASKLLVYAVQVWARVFEKALTASGVRPPKVDVNIATLLAGMEMPMQWIIHRLADAADKAAVQAIYQELQATGKVEAHLPEENRVIRQEAPSSSDRNSTRRTASLPSESTAAAFTSKATSEPSPPVWSNAPLPSPPITTPTIRKTIEAAPALPSEGPRMNSDSASAKDRFHLSESHDVVDAPSIGPKMAHRLKAIGVTTVGDLLQGDPAPLASKLSLKHVSAETIEEWQDQARLVCQIPELRGHDAQILVGSGYRGRSQVAAANIEQITRDVTRFLESPLAQRTLRQPTMPERAEMQRWIRHAEQLQQRRAA